MLGSGGRQERRLDRADEIKQVIARSLQIPVETLTDDATLQDLGIPSIQVIEMVFDLEEAFDIAISLDGRALATDGAEGGKSAFRTVGDVVRGVQGLVDAKAGG